MLNFFTAAHLPCTQSVSAASNAAAAVTPPGAPPAANHTPQCAAPNAPASSVSSKATAQSSPGAPSAGRPDTEEAPPPYAAAPRLAPDAGLVGFVLVLYGLPGWLAMVQEPKLSEKMRQEKLLIAMGNLAGPRLMQILQHADFGNVIHQVQADAQDTHETIVCELMCSVLAFAFPSQAAQLLQESKHYAAVPKEVDVAAKTLLSEAHQRFARIHACKDALRKRGLMAAQAMAATYLDEKSPKSIRLAGGGLAVILGGVGVGAVPIFVGLGATASLGSATSYTSLLAAFGGGAATAGGGGMAAGLPAIIGLATGGGALLVGGAAYLGYRAVKQARLAKNLSAAFEATGIPLEV